MASLIEYLILGLLHMILLREYLLDLRGSQSEPLRVGILRKPCYIELYYLAKDGDILGMLGKPFCCDSDELSRLSLVCVSEVLHFFVCYYICWIIRDLHNCLEFSYKGTNFSADIQIQSVNNQ